MSRVGSMPIEVPKGTKVSMENGFLTAEGPKGKVSERLFDGFDAKLDDGVLTVGRPDDSSPMKALHGLQRSLLANAVNGVTTGFVKALELNGVGYKAEVRGREIHFALGYSHPVVFKIPEGIDVEIDRNNRITVAGPNRQQVGQVAADIRKLRKPDPYKGKGIKYADEILRRKVGKTGAK